MEYVFALVLSAFFTIVYLYFKKNKTILIKPKAIKKEELVENYRVELLGILEKYEDNIRKAMQQWYRNSQPCTPLSILRSKSRCKRRTNRWIPRLRNIYFFSFSSLFKK